MEVLESTANPFGGVIPEPEALPQEPEEFRRQLELSLRTWKVQGYKVVWLELRIALAALVPAAVEMGFFFHHTGDGYLMLTRRMVDGAFIPPYASHYIGAGGVVINSRDELLVVHEKVGRRGRPRSYKLPGGAMHEGEHLVDGVVREVYEETGVRTRFKVLVCLRNLHGYRYGKSDIYFVCRLEPLSHRIVIQAEEIEECLWMPVRQYFEADNVSTFNKLIVRAAMKSPGLAPGIIDGYRDPATHEVFMPVDAEEKGDAY